MSKHYECLFNRLVVMSVAGNKTIREDAFGNTVEKVITSERTLQHTATDKDFVEYFLYTYKMFKYRGDKDDAKYRKRIVSMSEQTNHNLHRDAND